MTGGTGTLGGAFIDEALKAGAHVYFSYRTRSEKTSALEGAGAHGFQIDLAARPELSGVKETIRKAHGRLDILINAAAEVRDRTVKNLSVEDWDRVLDVNLSGVFHITKTFLPLLYRSTQGKILNIVSRVGAHGGFGQSNYAAAKAGLLAFTHSLAGEVGRKGILVNALNPGFMISRMTEGLPPEALERPRKESLIGAVSNPQEVAQFMVYLLSDRCSTVSGQVFHYESRRL